MTRIIASSIVVLTLAAGAQADLTAFVTVTANSSAGTASWTSHATPVFDADGNATWNWTPAGGAAMSDPNNHNQVGTINWLAGEYNADPIVNLAFNVSAGGVDTLFTITSGLLGFAAIPSAEGRATAAITVSDGDDNGVGYTLGMYGGPNSYVAAYNGVIPAATPFAFLLRNLTITGSTTSDSANAAFPPVGFFPMGTVFSMQTQYSFVLSANDLASGTSSFVVRAVPTPGAAALLGLGGLALGRRRR